MVRHEGVEAEESKPVATMGLSTVFDSSAATIRLAAMTSSPEDVEEFAKTLKVVRPTMEAINQAALPTSKPKAAKRTIPVHTRRGGVNNTTPGKSGNLLFIAILALLLIGLVLAFLI